MLIADKKHEVSYQKANSGRLQLQNPLGYRVASKTTPSVMTVNYLFILFKTFSVTQQSHTQ